MGGAGCGHPAQRPRPRPGSRQPTRGAPHLAGRRGVACGRHGCRRGEAAALRSGRGHARRGGAQHERARVRRGRGSERAAAAHERGAGEPEPAAGKAHVPSRRQWALSRGRARVFGCGGGKGRSAGEFEVFGGRARGKALAVSAGSPCDRCSGSGSARAAARCWMARAARCCRAPHPRRRPPSPKKQHPTAQDCYPGLSSGADMSPCTRHSRQSPAGGGGAGGGGRKHRIGGAGGAAGGARVVRGGGRDIRKGCGGPAGAPACCVEV
jgi:hypothetical protein